MTPSRSTKPQERLRGRIGAWAPIIVAALAFAGIMLLAARSLLRNPPNLDPVDGGHERLFP